MWVLAAIITYTILWQTSDALVNRLGFAFDALGIYFLIRGLVKDPVDIERVIKIWACISIFVAAAMLVEWQTGRNLFSVFGGVPQFTEVRMGRRRCEGAFLHPINAGIFGASLFPLFVSLYWSARKHKGLAVFGAAAATIITITSASAGPLMAYLAGIAALLMWPLRKSMRAVRWGILFTITGLQIVMKSPVWSLIGRADIVSGNTAYHREVLIDQFVSRFHEWWLLGTKSTAGWSANFLDPTDLTNQYIAVGVQGGLLTLVLFVVVIALCFQAVGRARKAFETQPTMGKLSWAFGAALFAHIVAFLGTSYWDQLIFVWYSTLALISALSNISGGLESRPNESVTPSPSAV